jgi:hypothetical protein
MEVIKSLGNWQGVLKFEMIDCKDDCAADDREVHST